MPRTAKGLWRTRFGTWHTLSAIRRCEETLHSALIGLYDEGVRARPEADENVRECHERIPEEKLSAKEVVSEDLLGVSRVK